MAVGHAQPHQREELLEGLLSRCGISNDPTEFKFSHMNQSSQRIVLLAIACLQNCHQLNPELRSTLEAIAAQMLPPKSLELASVLAAAGDVVFEGLASHPPRTTPEAIASIRLATLLGSDIALQAIAEIGEHHIEIEPEIARAWSFFDPEEYARTVLSRMRAGRNLIIKDPAFLPLLNYYMALESVEIDGDLWLEHLVDLPERPFALRRARIVARHLRDLTGIDSFVGIKMLDLDVGDTCPDLLPLARLKEIEQMRISTIHPNVLDLRPLVSLRNLRILQLWQPRSYHLQLGPLTGKEITIYVPPGREVKGFRGNQSPKCNVIKTQSFPAIFPE